MANGKRNFGEVNLEANWATFEPVDNRIGEIKLLLRPMGPEKEKEVSDLSDKDDRAGLIEAMSDLIAGWNLEKDGEAIELNPDTLAFYWPRLCRLRVNPNPEIENEGFTKDERAAQNFLLTRVMLFCGRIENFLKN